MSYGKAFDRRASHAEASADGWLQTYPELQTRPLLVEEMIGNRTLRHALFSGLNVLENVALLPDQPTRRRVFAVMEGNVRSRLFELKPLLEAKSFELFNQAIGAYRNIVHNMQAGLYEHPVKPKVGQHNVHVERFGVCNEKKKDKG